MAAFNHISGQEPSTISFKIATVTQTRNSSQMHQEILTLGDPESSLGLAAVLNAKPPSTTWALAVREVSTHSTIVAVSSVGGVVTVQQNSTVWQVQVGGYSTTVNVSSLGGVVSVQQNSTTWAVQLTQYSTIMAVSSLGGAVIMRSSAANALVTVYQSTAADLNVTVAGYSTTVNVSSLGGIVAVRPSDTNWASSAGFHFDTNGALNIAGSFSASTTVNVSSVAGVVAVAPSDTNYSINAGLHFDSNGALMVTGVTQSTTANSTVNVSSVAGLVSVRDETYLHGGAYTFSTVSGGMLMGRASSATPASVGADDDASVFWLSMQGALNVILRDSTGGLLQPNSTIFTVSTGSVRVHQSTAADLLAVVTIGTNIQSTAAPSSGSSGLIVRPVVDLPLTFASTSAFATSSIAAINSTATGQRCKVFAYSITTTNQTPTQLQFYGGSSLKWALVLSAISSAVSGANLAVSPPAFLFGCGPGSSMTLRCDQGTTSPGWKISVAYFMSP